MDLRQSKILKAVDSRPPLARADRLLCGGGGAGVEEDEADSAAGGVAGISGYGSGREAARHGGGGGSAEGEPRDDHGEPSGGAGALLEVGAVAAEWGEEEWEHAAAV